MKKIIRVRCYPNETQEKMINMTLRACNKIYTDYINEAIDQYTNGTIVTSLQYYEKIKKLSKTVSKYKIYRGISKNILREYLKSADIAVSLYRDGNETAISWINQRIDMNSFKLPAGKINCLWNMLDVPLLGAIRIQKQHDSFYKNISSITNIKLVRDIDDKYYFICIVDDYDKHVCNVDLYGTVSIALSNDDYIILSQEFDNDVLLESCYITEYDEIIPSFENDKFIKEKKELINILKHEIINSIDKTPQRTVFKLEDIKSYEDISKFFIPKSKIMKTLDELYSKLYDIEHEMDQYINNFIIGIVDDIIARNPENIIIENIPMKIRGARIKYRNSDDNDIYKHMLEKQYGFFYEYLLLRCKEQKIGVAMPKDSGTIYKVCSNCNTYHADFDTSSNTFRCNDCHLEISTELNTARLLSNHLDRCIKIKL